MPEVALILRVAEQGSLSGVVSGWSAGLKRVESEAARVAQSVTTSMTTVRKVVSGGGTGGYFSESAMWDPAPMTKAVATVKAQGQTLDTAMRSIAQTAHLTENPYRRAAESLRGYGSSAATAAFSAERFGTVLTTMGMAFGNVNPMIAMGAFQLGRFGTMLSGLTPGMMALGAGAAGVGVSVMAMVGRAQEAARVEERFAQIQRAGYRGDRGALSAGLTQTQGEIESVDRASGGSLIGAAVERGKDLFRFLLGSPTRRNEATRAAAQWEGGLQAAVARAQALEASQATADRSGRTIGDRRDLLQRLMGEGVAGPGTIALHTDRMRADLESQTAARLAASQQQLTIEMKATQAVEHPLLQQQERERAAVIKEEAARQGEEISRLRIDLLRQDAARQLAVQSEILRDTLARQGAASELGLATRTAARAGERGLYLGGYFPSEWVREQRAQELEYGGTRADIEDARAVNDQKVRDLERTQTTMRALLQGYLAQGLVTERDYHDQVRQMEQELTMAKLQGLQQYGAALNAALGKAASDHQKYAEQVRSLDREIGGQGRTNEDLEAEIRRAGMSPAEVLADRERMAERRLTEAMQADGKERIDLLRSLQREYGAIAVEAARAAAEQKKAVEGADLTRLPWSDWQSAAGQRSKAGQQFWGKPESGPGSDAWWAGGAWGQNAWDPSGAGARAAATAAADRARTIGELIVQGLKDQRDAAQQSANTAKAMALHMQAAADQAARLAAELTRAQVPQAPAAPGTGGAGDWSRPLDTYGSWQRAADSIVDQIRGGGDTGGGDAGGGGGGGGEGMAAGGVIPGGWGQPRPITAHGGEVIGYPAQMVAALQAALERTGGAAGGGDLVVQVSLDGRAIAGAIRIPLQDAIARGGVRIQS